MGQGIQSSCTDGFLLPQCIENITAEHAFHMILLQFFAKNEEWMIENELLVNGEIQVYVSNGHISAEQLLSRIIENL